MKSHYYIGVCYKQKWSFWNGNKFIKTQSDSKNYLTLEDANKVKSSLQKLQPGLDLVVKEVVS